MLRTGIVVQVEGSAGETLTLEVGRILLKDQERYEELSASFDIMLLLALANSYDAQTGEYDMDKMAFIVNTVFRVGAALTQSPPDSSNNDDPSNDDPSSDGLSSDESSRPPVYTPEDCAGQIELYTSRPFPEEMQGRMSALVALVLSRKHPNIDAAAVGEWLDLTSFLTILRAFYQVNHGIRERF